MSQHNKQPLMISHRGFHLDALENSLAAFDEAYDQGFRAMETDLRTTKDNHIVLCHDPSLKRTFNREMTIETATKQELASLRTDNGHSLAFFDEIIDRFKDVRWTLDIKAESARKTIGLLLETYAKTLEGKRFLENSRFLTWRLQDELALKNSENSSFAEDRFYARESECYRAVLKHYLRFPFIDLAPNKTYAVPATFKGLNLFRSSPLQRYKRAGLKTVAFLPGSTEQTNMAIELGFDEIITNLSYYQ